MARQGKRDSAKEQFWRKALARFATSGLSQAQFCKEEGLRAHTFSYWRQTITDRDAERRTVDATVRTRTRQDFVPVVVTQSVSKERLTQKEVVAEVVFQSGFIRLFDSISEEFLRAIVAILRESAI